MNQKLRPLNIELNESNDTCSVKLDYGKTSVICTIVGPLTSKGQFSEKGVLQCEVRFTGGSSRLESDKGQSSGSLTSEERQLSLQVHDALYSSILLSKYPKSTIAVYILIMTRNGSELAACINSASIALTHANIELQDIVTACTIYNTKFNQGNSSSNNNNNNNNNNNKEEILLIDPYPEEIDNENVSRVVIAKMCNLKKITQIIESGKSVNINLLQEMLDMGEESCNELSNQMHLFLIQQQQLSD